MKERLTDIVERKFPGAVEVAPGKYAALAEDRDHYFIVEAEEVVKPRGPHMVTDMPPWWTPAQGLTVDTDTGEIVMAGYLG